MSVTVAPYGQWASPISGESYVARTVTLSQVRVDGPDTYWVEGHPKSGGRNTLLRRNRMGQTTEVLPMIEGVRLPDVRTRVHEYGGRAYAVKDRFIVFSDGTDDRLYSFDMGDPKSRITPLTPMDGRRYGDLEIAEVRGVVYAVCEDHREEGEPTNYLVAVPLDGSAARDGSAIKVIFNGTDFVMAPTLSPDGAKLAWLSWNHPEMPWTQSSLHVASVDFEGRLSEPVTLINTPGVCVYEPRWTANGDLVHVDDSTGWANLYITRGLEWLEGEDSEAWRDRVETTPLHQGQRAFSHPHWQLGLHSFDVLDDDNLICSWAENRTWHIGTVNLTTGELNEHDLGFWPCGNVAAADGRYVVLADSATTSPAIVEVRGNYTSVIRPSSEADIDVELISQAQPVSWPTRDGETAFGFYYAPTNPDFEAPAGTLPPLIVAVHGGPTTASRPGFNVPFQFWTSRGFAVLDVNYRGSTGLGRAYRERLNGAWGVMEVNDCADGAQYLIEQGLVDAQRIAIRGGSAGGYTTLQALTSTDVFTAGTSFYGISDLKTLREQTHKFESRYMYRLIGSNDTSDPVWVERSPIHHCDRIQAPLLILQGSEDKVVPPAQSQVMFDALKNAGKAVAMKIYDGEGHGFRRAENIRDSWATELAFYATVWGFEADGASTDLHIENL